MEIKVTIHKITNPGANPPWVQCSFRDAWGRKHTIHEKLPVVMANASAAIKLPATGSIACRLLRRWQDNRGRQLVTITTREPWDIESTQGLCEFDLPQSALLAASSLLSQP